MTGKYLFMTRVNLTSQEHWGKWSWMNTSTVKQKWQKWNSQQQAKHANIYIHGMCQLNVSRALGKNEVEWTEKQKWEKWNSQQQVKHANIMIFKAIWDVKTGNFHSCMVSAEGTLNLDSTGAQHCVHTKITCMHSLMQNEGSPHPEPCFPGTFLQTFPKLVMPLKGRFFFSFMITTQVSLML